MKKVIILIIVGIVIITGIVAIAMNKNSKDSNTGNNNIRNEIQQEEMPQDNIDMKEPSSSEQVGL